MKDSQDIRLISLLIKHLKGKVIGVKDIQGSEQQYTMINRRQFSRQSFSRIHDIQHMEG